VPRQGGLFRLTQCLALSPAVAFTLGAFALAARFSIHAGATPARTREPFQHRVRVLDGYVRDQQRGGFLQGGGSFRVFVESESGAGSKTPLVTALAAAAEPMHFDQSESRLHAAFVTALFAEERFAAEGTMRRRGVGFGLGGTLQGLALQLRRAARRVFLQMPQALIGAGDTLLQRAVHVMGPVLQSRQKRRRRRRVAVDCIQRLTPP